MCWCPNIHEVLKELPDFCSIQVNMHFLKASSWIVLLPLFHDHPSGVEEPQRCCLSSLVGVLVEVLVQGETLTVVILRGSSLCIMGAAVLESCLNLCGCCIPNGCYGSRDYWMPRWIGFCSFVPSTPGPSSSL